MRRYIAAVALLLVAGLACGQPARTPTPAPAPRPQTAYPDYYARNPLVHQAGQHLVDPAGRPLRLRGVNLGGWLLWEGWEYGKGLNLSQSTMLSRLEELVGPAATDDFEQQVYATYITEADIRRIAQLGFNSVRVPVNAKILEDDAQPYVYKDSGWQILDRTLAWCERYGLWAILDLHAVPGGQSRLSPSDPGPKDQLIWTSEENQQRTVALWRAIATRYRDRRIVAGYDLINEPLPPKGEQLAGLERRLVEAIREVDPYHLVIVEGAKFSSDFSMFSEPLSGNQAYGFHMYNWFGDDRTKRLAYLRSVTDAQQVPLWVGEFGENKYDMIASTVALYDDPANEINAGWSFWTWKKVPARYPGLVVFDAPATWQPVIEWLSWPDRKHTPERAAVLRGMQDFLEAIRLEHTTLDERMLRALLP